MSGKRSLRLSQMVHRNEELSVSKSSIRSSTVNDRDTQFFIDKLFKERLNESRGPRSQSSHKESLNEIEENPSEEECSCVQNLFETQNFGEQQVLSQGECGGFSHGDFSKSGVILGDRSMRTTRERRLNSVISERGIKSEESSGGPKSGRREGLHIQPQRSPKSQTSKRSRTLSSVKSNLNQNGAEEEREFDSALDYQGQVRETENVSVEMHNTTYEQVSLINEKAQSEANQEETLFEEERVEEEPWLVQEDSRIQLPVEVPEVIVLKQSIGFDVASIYSKRVNSPAAEDTVEEAVCLQRVLSSDGKVKSVTKTNPRATPNFGMLNQPQVRYNPVESKSHESELREEEKDCDSQPVTLSQIGKKTLFKDRFPEKPKSKKEIEELSMSLKRSKKMTVESDTKPAQEASIRPKNIPNSHQASSQQVHKSGALIRKVTSPSLKPMTPTQNNFRLPHPPQPSRTAFAYKAKTVTGGLLSQTTTDENYRQRLESQCLRPNKVTFKREQCVLCSLEFKIYDVPQILKCAHKAHFKCVQSLVLTESQAIQSSSSLKQSPSLLNKENASASSNRQLTQVHNSGGGHSSKSGMISLIDKRSNFQQVFCTNCKK